MICRKSIFQLQCSNVLGHSLTISKIFHSLRNRVTSPNVYPGTHHLVPINLGASMKSSIASLVRKSAFTLCLSAIVLGGCASMSSAPAELADGVLTGPNGMRSEERRVGN